ncbi:MAG: hypothetical protein HY782_10955 [Chloroflexi bacterium]|nr:hypothetical protein [Chloroflexota bacterium]
MNRRDLLTVAGLAALAAVFFAPVLFGGQVLIPFDNLFRFPPWSAFAAQFGVSAPHNELVLDLVLENYAWKQFVAESLRARELPLWNPYLFAGVPFLAAGQHSALYPFSILFYVLPVDRAYGYFVALQLALAAITMYAFTRVLRLGRFAATISAIVYAFSSFMVVSTTFPMVISAAAWLPAILACAELILRSKDSARRILYVLLGAIFLGIQFLAGHIEISLYVLMVTAFYVLWRGVQTFEVLETSKVWASVAMMTGIGITLAAVQLVPLYELVQGNFRSGSVTLQDVIGWAYPSRQILTFLMPDFFGNPTHHSYSDIFDFTLRAAPTGTIFWGIKNYVEAGSYVGILPLVLALMAIVTGFKSQVAGRKSQVALFATLALVSLVFVFGTPLYGILFYLVPGFNQLHTPFRWVFPYTLSMAVLAGFGAQLLASRREGEKGRGGERERGREGERERGRGVGRRAPRRARARLGVSRACARFRRRHCAIV